MTPVCFHPTPHTAALLAAVRQHGERLREASVLEIGTGSGVVLQTMLALGAARALGVDVEPEAVRCSQALLAQQGMAARARVLQGDLWLPCEGERFDLIATNLPQFPLRQPLGDGRLPTWSSGGADGRALIDPFLAGLARHLAPRGRALMTHNVFCDLARTHALLAEQGLQARTLLSVSVPLPPLKLEALPAPVLQAWLGRGLFLVGEFGFGDFEVLEIGHALD